MQSNWFDISAPNPNAKLRLICFPYAGGNATTFNRWAAILNSRIELIAIQPPGRSNRLQESPFNNMDDLIDNLMQVIPSVLDKPYVIFGHSLGSRVGFELLCRLQHHALRLPEHFVASGSRDQNVSIQELNTWQQHFFQPANFILFNGGHFFIDSHQQEVVPQLNHGLKQSSINYSSTRLELTDNQRVRT